MPDLYSAQPPTYTFSYPISHASIILHLVRLITLYIGHCTLYPHSLVDLFLGLKYSLSLDFFSGNSFCPVRTRKHYTCHSSSSHCHLVRSGPGGQSHVHPRRSDLCSPPVGKTVERCGYGRKDSEVKFRLGAKPCQPRLAQCQNFVQKSTAQNTVEFCSESSYRCVRLHSYPSERRASRRMRQDCEDIRPRERLGTLRRRCFDKYWRSPIAACVSHAVPRHVDRLRYFDVPTTRTGSINCMSG